MIVLEDANLDNAARAAIGSVLQLRAGVCFD